MSVDQASLGSFGDLGIALGLLDSTGRPNASWFSDPVGGGSAPTANGLKHVMEDQGQREALTRFVDHVLGAPDATIRDGATWVPLFRPPDVAVTIYAVVHAVDAEVRLGFALEHTTAGAAPPTVTTRVHVPVFRFPQRGNPLVSDGSLPVWLALGRPGGEIEIGVDARLTDHPPPAGQPGLGGVALAVAVPTYDGDVGFELTLRDLQLPGAAEPETFTLDVAHPDRLAPRMLDLVTGLVRAQAETLDLDSPALRPFAALAGLLGLRDVGDVPRFPFADLPTRGVAALVGWVELVLADDDHLRAWLGQLAALVGGAVDPSREAVVVPIGDAPGVGRVEVVIGVRVRAGTGGHPLLVPWVEVSVASRTGVRAGAAVDLLRVDTGNGTCLAVPDARIEAVFGADAGGGPLVAGAPQLRVGSLHVGVGLDQARRPAFVLTAADVVVAGAQRDLVDLSSPDAALAAGADLVTGALADALSALGDAGALVSRLLGLTGPSPVSVPHLVADPVGTIRDHWRVVLTDAAATADLLGRLSALVRGRAAVVAPGDGTSDRPWLVALADVAHLEAWREGEVLHVDLAAALDRPLLGGLTSTTQLAVGLARVDFAGPHATFGTGGSLRSTLKKADATPARLSLGAAALEATDLAVELLWQPASGLRVQLTSRDLALDVQGSRIDIPLPSVDASGTLSLAAPDWQQVEQALAGLVAELEVPEVDAAFALLGWSGTGPHLALADLLGGDAESSLEVWLGDLILDCDHVRDVLGPVAALLSGFSFWAPMGSGNASDPFRCPVAGEPRAPGLRVWLDPGCAVPPGTEPAQTDRLLGSPPPDPAAVADALRQAGGRLPDIADLLVGRDSLAAGLQLLLDRWRGTDGLVGRPGTLPGDVEALELAGFGYDELRAFGRSGSLVPRLVAAPGTVVHVSTDDGHLVDRPGGSTADLSGAGAGSTLPAGAGPFFVRLPTPTVAAAARPDRGDVGEQAARLVDLLASRTDDVVLVGYGDAGAACVRAARSLALVTDVVTVGTPWADTSYLAISAGLGADALQLLGRLQRHDVPVWPDTLLGGQCTPLQGLRLLVRRSLAALRADGQLPSADAETRRAGLSVHAVFGALDLPGLASGLGAFAADAVAARTDLQGGATPGPVTAVHVTVDVPVLDLNLGGLLIGVGAAFETCRLTRADPGLEVTLARALVVDVHLGVHDGWLVGGPGSTSATGDLRWASARVTLPFDETPGACELVLHEARGLGVDRERWVVTATPGPDGTVAVPEVRVLIGDLVARLRTASPHLATLLTRFGLLDATGGLDPTGLDHLLHDTEATLTAQLRAAPDEVADALRHLVADVGGTGAELGWRLGPATVGLDLATGQLTGSLRSAVEGVLPLELDVMVGRAGSHATLAVGALDPHLGGARVVARTAQGVQAGGVTAEWAAAGGVTRSAGLWPAFETAPVTELATIALPTVALAALARATLAGASGPGGVALENGLSAAGLLRRPTFGPPVPRVPIGFVLDPVAYVVGVARSSSADVARAGHDLLDAMSHLVSDAPPGSGGWPLADGVALRYAVSGEALTVALHVEIDETLDAHLVVTSFAAGVVLRPGVLPAPSVDVSLRVDGIGLDLGLDPHLHLSLLRPVPLAPLPLYPDGPGLGQAFETAAESLVPELLNRIAALGGGSAGLQKDVGVLVGHLGDALDLRESSQFTASRIAIFAVDPGAGLLGHLPQLLAEPATAVADALNGASPRVIVSRAPGRTTFGFGSVPGPTLGVTLDTTGTAPAVDLAAEWPLPDVGTVRLDSLRLSAAGVAIGARIGPVPVHAGPVSLRPLLSVRAGSGATTDRLLSLGLALDDDAVRSVELRWGLDGHAPVLAAVDRDALGAVSRVNEPDAPARLLSVGVGLAGGVLAGALPASILDARVIRMLRGVVLTEAATTPDIDPSVATDLLDPARLLHRLERLLWNVATDPDPVRLTIDDEVTIALAADGTGDDRSLGLSLSLATPDTRFTLADSDTRVELEVDATWLEPSVTPGIAVYVVHGVKAGDSYTFSLRPGFSVAGLGIRFTKASGPLLSLGPIGLDGVAVRVYAQADEAGIGGGAQVELIGLAVAPGGAGGSNAVANGIMNDAGRSSPAQRPVFSPALAVQRHPGDPNARVSIRAGRPPGPWWVVVQRQLGPLYIERLGFDSAETNGQVSRIALLFDGRVEIFGFTAAVDQLTIAWRGGDLLDLHQWEVDLMGLAVSADMSGIVLAGGMLKTVDGTGDNQVVSYVGMLLGRFGVYGLTVFGGYANLHGDPSLFVFGAVNGPIGGPPAFFITGLGGGLGINRKLVIPEDPREFPTYPFIAALDPYASVPDPMTELRRLNGYFGPERGSFWFAAGISFTCFSLVDGIAVVAVAFGDGGFELDLMGLARMALPNPAAALVSIELGLLAKFSTREGVFMIRAALTDNSWLLYSDVRLTGGFAFVTWWKGPLAGQFVLTVGGYHPDFHKDGYPDVPRVGLSWQVSSEIMIKGGAYFALTSEALMAGIGVEAVADFGWAWVRARFGADGLVYFDPFWYDVSVYATISAGVSVDIWPFGEISFSITTGASVHVWGPDFSGEASVEVGPCSVTVPFGSRSPREGAALEWSGFVPKYLEDAGGGRARALSGITGRGSLPAATGGARSAPAPDGTGDHPFEVFAEFELTLVTSVPTAAFDLGSADNVTVAVVRSDGAGATLGLNPMRAAHLGSTMQVRLERFREDTHAWVDDTADLEQLQHTIATGSFPIGVWGSPDVLAPGQKVPSRLPAGDVLFAGNQVTLEARATMLAAGPQIDYYRVEAGRRPLPLSAPHDLRASLAATAVDVTLPAPATAAAALTFAATLLFDRTREAGPAGALPGGLRSRTARAGYAGSVAAPPLFGSLVDGLAIDNAAGASSAPADPPAARQPPVPQDPRVLGYFAAGSGVAFRRAGTTVADSATKRRPAPSLDSVHGRLGRHLPVSLDVTLPPGGAVAETFSPGTLPFTAVPGSSRSFTVGDASALSRVGGITGFGGAAPSGAKAARAAGVTAKAAGAPATVASGDVVVLHAPDHATDTSEDRPVLDLGGAARVTFVRGDGLVLADTQGAGGVDVPAGTALAAVQADGLVEGLDGSAGWHSRSRVAALSGLVATGPGCVLVVDSGLTPVEPGWTTAGDLVRGAARVLTRFGTTTRAVAVVVESDTPDRVDEMGLRLDGASRALGADGTPVPAHLVMNGAQAVAVYDVVPDPQAAAVSVAVASGGMWRLTGVLASTGSAEQLAAVLIRDGLVASTARMAAAAGAGCSPVWRQAGSTPKRARSRAPSQKASKKGVRRGRR